MTTYHQILSVNKDGRDFVVGDLHGCLDLLEEQLDLQHFDTQRDRLFSVGDLTDRGLNSLGCLRLLHQPWFHAVVGNHEDMLLSHFLLRESNYHSPRDVLRNGGEWITQLSVDEEQELRDELLPLVLALPYVISVEDTRPIFHVVHAELTIADDQLSESALSQMVTELIWNRRLIREVRSATWSKRQTPEGTLATSHQPWDLGKTLRFVGHTPISVMVLHRSHLFIDGGAFLRKDGSRLHVIDIANAQDWIDER